MTPLKQILAAEGRKQRWLAEQIGVHESLVSRYCRGLHPDDRTKAAIAAVLGRTVADLWGTDGSPTDAREAA